MQAFLYTVLLLLFASTAAQGFPKVQVYTQMPGEVGKANLLLCHVSGFHPPQISIELLKNGHSLSGSLQTDLAFEDSWQYYLTKYVSFTPTTGDDYACRVTHVGQSKTYIWESDM